ncbi:ABC transporter substrate-binding protein [Alkalihalobacillus pseudalcaliphilus]|uniref:ABC transporter substrate-binding protein n=1 Tax=Alkalihalobacillus pseudalcaliphilus TaxID=79884 RepID=UPI00064DDB16|nr:ABC transporter substrate-binding protein [Alkalihalobacillus pseudalcaliphilus]KMK78259.1 metal ABC transporter substrate-binding protein [Alkalihalobacillus pseudalcaliphilus]
MNIWLKGISGLLIFLMLAGCGDQASEESPGQANDDNQTEDLTEEEGPYTVTDDAGTEFTFEEVPERVISLQPSMTEILFALGVGEKVVGVTTVDNYPEEVLEIEQVSDSWNVNAEAIIALDPDVVFAYTIGEKEKIEPLLDAEIPVFVIASALTFDDVYSDIEQIAAVMNAAEQGEEVIADIQAVLAEVDEKVQSVEERKQIYFEISPAPEIYTAGGKTFQNEMMEKAGVENIFADTEGWPMLSGEEVVSRNPEQIYTTVNYEEDPISEIKQRDGWGTIDAIVNDEVFELNNDLMSRPGPRVGEAVKHLAEIAYPELFE